jgi:hypothetical protein
MVKFLDKFDQPKWTFINAIMYPHPVQQ